MGRSRDSEMTDPAYGQLRSRYYYRPRDRGTADKRDEIPPLHVSPSDHALSKGRSLALCDRAASEKWR